MMHKKSIYEIMIFSLILFTMSFGQFVEVNVDIDLRRLSEGDRQLFHGFGEDLEEYFLNTQFSPDVTDFEIIINFRLVLESVSRGGSQISINAQAIFTNGLDQYFYAKGIQFPYSKGQKITHDSSFDYLALFLDYYALMFIAAELDTWEYMGGTPFYARAIAKADIGKDSNWSRGWEDRWKKGRKIKNNQYLRNMRFNYFLVQDELKNEKIDYDRVYKAMETFYEDLKFIDEKLGSNKETLKFLDAYHLNIAKLLSILEIKDGLQVLMYYDHDNKKVYESYLKN